MGSGYLANCSVLSCDHQWILNVLLNYPRGVLVFEKVKHLGQAFVNLDAPASAEATWLHDPDVVRTGEVVLPFALVLEVAEDNCGLVG